MSRKTFPRGHPQIVIDSRPQFPLIDPNEFIDNSTTGTHAVAECPDGQLGIRVGQSNRVHPKETPYRYHEAHQRNRDTGDPGSRDPQNCPTCSRDGADDECEYEAAEKPSSKIDSQDSAATFAGPASPDRGSNGPPSQGHLRSATRTTVPVEAGRLNCCPWRFVRIRLHGVLRIPAALNTRAGGPFPARGSEGTGSAGSLRRRSGCNPRRLPWWRCLRHTGYSGSAGRRPGCCLCRG